MATKPFDFRKFGIQKIEFPGLGRSKRPAPEQAPKLGQFAAMEAQAVIAQLQSTSNGLSQREAEKRQRERGRNVLSESHAHPVYIFFHQFVSPLVIVLLLAGAISYYSGAKIDALIIGCIVLVSVLINFVQEYRATSAAQKLKERVATRATVVRDGSEREIPIAELCQGDVVVLCAGDLVPADCRIIESKDLFVNQSSLTGESLPAEKHAAAIASSQASLSDLTNILFMGSSVMSGTARVLVVEIGARTQFGHIAQSLSEAPVENDFDRGIRSFSILVIRSIVALILFIFIILALIKHQYLEALLFGVAVSVGLTPDLLPMILSITMARGSVRMSKKGVIVKHLASIPNLGSMDVLCMDKTGTLTEDHIELVKYVDLEGAEDDQVLVYTYLNSLYQTGIRNPLDRSVLEFKKPHTLKTIDFVKVDEIPFDFVRRRVSIVVARGHEKICITKGAPEEIIKICSHALIAGKAVPVAHGAPLGDFWDQYTKLSADGYRVLAVATRRLLDGDRHAYRTEDERDMTLVGFVAFLDPPKRDVKHTLLELHRRGITVKVVTGDNELVTKKICSEIGLVVKGVLLGSEVDAYTDEALAKKVEETTVFARFSPAQKNRVILALQSNGHVVGYLGDGINDAPSLKSADVGISVDSATDVAKESADIILTHKSLKELLDGIVEGRRTFGNSMKYILMSISSNFGNMFSVAAAVVFLPFLPMLPVMILFNNLLYDVSQVTIPTDSVDDEYIERPRRWDVKFIRKFMLVFGPISSVFDFLTFGLLYLVFGASAAIFQTGWFLESIATQTLVIHVIRTRRVPFFQSVASTPLLVSTLAVVAVAWIVPFTPLGVYLGFAPISWSILLALIAVSAGYLVVVQLAKSWFYRRYGF